MIIKRFLWIAGVMLLAHPGFADTLEFKNGVRLSGFFEGGSSRFVRFRTDSGVQDYDILTVHSVRISGPAAEAKNEPQRANTDRREETYSFSPDQERLIRVWFSQSSNRRNLPPGLAKRQTLPPGLERQLQKNGTLPPGLERRLEPLPVTLESQLPPLPRGMRRVVLSGNVILLEEATALIIDLLRNVF